MGQHWFVRANEGLGPYGLNAAFVVLRRQAGHPENARCSAMPLS